MSETVPGEGVEASRVEYERPADWYGWQPDELGHSVDLSSTLVRTDRAAIALAGAYAGRAGAMLFLHWVLRRQDLGGAAWARILRLAHADPDEVEHDEEQLTAQVLLADGLTASTTAGFQHDRQPTGPVLSAYFGRSTSGSRERIHGRTKLWLHPLPPLPTMDLTVAWPAVGIPPATATLPTTALRDAGHRTNWIWPSDEDLLQRSH